MSDTSATSRILTLVFTDLANSTALKTLHGDQSVGDLIARHRAYVSRLALDTGGRIIDWAGDGCFLTFVAPSSAVLFALRLQQRHKTERDLPGVRVGMHLGEVSERIGPDGDSARPRVEGLAVDLAARICALASPAQVLMSGSVADSARQRLDNAALEQTIRWQNHGRYALKGIDGAVDICEAGVEGVAPFAAPARAAGPRWSRRGIIVGTAAAATLAGIGGIAWQRGWFEASPSAGENSVAVLPFDNLSGDATQAYFSDGVAEEVRETLARSPHFRVIAKTSAAQFREHKADAISIAKKLGVAFLLDGSVRRAANVVRIGAELIDGRSGFSRWSQSFDRQLTDVFKIESDIASAVTVALTAQLGASAPLPNGAPQINTSGGTTNIVAYDAYLRGRAQYQLSADEAGMRSALQQFDNAIAADTQFANGQAARALCLMSIANQYAATPQQPALYAAALACAQRAVAIAPDLAAAQSTLGAVLFQGLLDVRGARAPFARAYALGGGEAVVLGRVALYAAHTGKTQQAAAAIAQAVLLDPLNPLVRLAVASVAYAARRYSASIAPAQLALTMNPRMPHAHALIGDALLMLGKTREAAAAYAAESVADYRLAGQAIAEQRSGNITAARAALRELESQSGDAALYQQAQVLAQLGDRDGALARLQRARALGDSGLVYARNDPLLNPLRHDPRLLALLKRIGFE